MIKFHAPFEPPAGHDGGHRDQQFVLFPCRKVHVSPPSGYPPRRPLNSSPATIAEGDSEKSQACHGPGRLRAAPAQEKKTPLTISLRTFLRPEPLFSNSIKFSLTTPRSRGTVLKNSVNARAIESGGERQIL